MNISPLASQQLVKIFAQKPGMKGLRIYIQGGGCSGFEYNFELVPSSHEEDRQFVFSHEGVSFFLCVDELSQSLLEQATLDYKVDLTGARFIIDNPNVSSHCSCGSSFSL